MGGKHNWRAGNWASVAGTTDLRDPTVFGCVGRGSGGWGYEERRYDLFLWKL